MSTFGSVSEAQQLAAAVGTTIDTAQAQALLSYLELLQRWNATYNLTAVRTAQGMWTQHLADCLAVVRPLSARLPGSRILDVGSGGGLPGAVLAVCLPGVQVTCVDAVRKKAAFVRQAAGELKLPNLHSLHARVEAAVLEPVDLIISRAFAGLADFVSLTHKHLSPTGVWVAMKGVEPKDEIREVRAPARVFHVEPLAVPGLDAQRCLVWMRKWAAAEDGPHRGKPAT